MSETGNRHAALRAGCGKLIGEAQRGWLVSETVQQEFLFGEQNGEAADRVEDVACTGAVPEVQVKSKDRVRDHGEVFTAEREVKAMVDLVGETISEQSNRTVLEPACGDGNFLAEILRRKCARVTQRRWRQGQAEELAFDLSTALSLLYGIDIMPDNAATCRERLAGILLDAFDSVIKGKDKPARIMLETAAKVIVGTNIVCGDALTMKTPDGAKPLVFVKWRAEKTRDRFFFGVTPYYFETLVNGDDKGKGDLFEIREPLKASGRFPFHEIERIHDFMKGAMP